MAAVQVPTEKPGTVAGKIPVHISFEIIRLFSEGLYQSPHKAIEELVSNGYDAQAEDVHVLLPDLENGEDADKHLWVVDNGDGMDTQGFQRLWRVANSTKADVDPKSTNRPPIGQFGIGKLASYVLAWRLTHISRVEGRILLTHMNFRDLEGIHQYDDHRAHEIELRDLSVEQAKEALRDIEKNSPRAWELMFGDHASATWTAAGLSDFKELYSKLSAGRLRWVLSTGLPLHSNFSIWLDGHKLASSKETATSIFTYDVGNQNDDSPDARKLPDGTSMYSPDGTSIQIPGIPGRISGHANIYEKQLTEGKSDQYNRSNGFFIRVRQRVINLENDLFGLPTLNHAAWARFEMSIDAEGLRDSLLSSREGVRDTDAIRELRKYLKAVFNECRKWYEKWQERQLRGLDLDSLLRDAPRVYVAEPISLGVRRAIETKAESFYIAVPAIPEGEDVEDWIQSFEADIADHPFDKVEYRKTGRYDRALRFVPDTRTLSINIEHPFIDKLLDGRKDRKGAILFGATEVLMDSLLQGQGFDPVKVLEILSDRDRTLRLVAGDQPSTAAEVLAWLDVANENPHALERAAGAAFKVLGFQYERRGGNRPGPDGVLRARLGYGEGRLENYTLVYDAKQTNSSAVSADKIDFGSLNAFRTGENAEFGFFIANRYSGEDDPESKLNRKAAGETGGQNGAPLCLLKIFHLRRLVKLHYQYGITLTMLRRLFESAHLPIEVDAWLDTLEKELTQAEQQVPLSHLLEALERAKDDQLSKPHVAAVRFNDPRLNKFTLGKLLAALRAVQTIVGGKWIEVEDDGAVTLHHGVDGIERELDLHRGRLFPTDTDE